MKQTNIWAETRKIKGFFVSSGLILSTAISNVSMLIRKAKYKLIIKLIA
jgi:hypothetical protein